MAVQNKDGMAARGVHVTEFWLPDVSRGTLE